jgi:integrase
MKGNLSQRGLNSWRLKYDLEPDGSGRRQTRYVTFRGTRKEAEAQAVKHLAAVADGLDVDPSRLTVAAHLNAWLEGPHGLAAKTHERYQLLVAQQIGMQCCLSAEGRVVGRCHREPQDTRIASCTVASRSRCRVS